MRGRRVLGKQGRKAETIFLRMSAAGDRRSPQVSEHANQGTGVIYATSGVFGLLCQTETD